MKRKLFSAILFGALLTASTSGLTSCKDYDDDISNLQGQIDKLATADQLSAKVSELQAAISAAQSAAESKAAAAQTVADAAKAAAGDAAAAAKAAQSTADGATQAAKDAAAAAAAANEVAKAAQAAVDKLAAEGHATKAELEAAAKAAQEYVDSVKKAIEDAHAADKAAIEKAIDEGLDAVKEEIAKTNEELAKLAARLDVCEQKLAALEAGEGQEEVLAEIQAEVELVADALESLGISVSEMVTAVSLYSNAKLGFANNDLEFYQVKEAVDRTFPVEDVANVTGNDTIQFTKGTVRALEDSILVRVSPANAVLHADDIALLNTQGKEFDASLFESIKVNELRREAPLTKSVDNQNTGLWVVKFQLKKDFDADNFKKNALYNDAQIAFALAVNNCDENLSDDRRVVTDYTIGLSTPIAVHADGNEIKLTPDGEATAVIKNVHHRYNNFTNPLAGTFPEAMKNNDWKWKDVYGTEQNIKDGKANITFDKDLSEKENDNTKNAKREGDSRQALDVLKVAEKQDIAIEFNKEIKGFYVTLDYLRAGESGRTELAAWNSYSYTNVGKIDETGKIIEAATMQYGKKGSIRINSLEQNSSLGDVIGFRIWAVNLDGTLVDPDGTSFYVGIGAGRAEAEAANVTVQVSKANVTRSAAGTKVSSMSNVTVVDVTELFGINFNGLTWTTSITDKDSWNSTDEKWENGTTISVDETGDKNVNIYYLDDNNNVIAKPTGNSLSGVKKIAFQVASPEKLIDGKAYKIVATLSGQVGNAVATLRTVTFNVTKELPATNVLPEGMAVSRDQLQSDELLLVNGAWDGSASTKLLDFTIPSLSPWVNPNWSYKSSDWKVGNVTPGYAYDSNYQWVANSNSWGIEPSYGTVNSYTINRPSWISDASQQDFGYVDFNDAYMYNQTYLNSQDKLGFIVAGAEVYAKSPVSGKNNAPKSLVFDKAWGAAGNFGIYEIPMIAGQFADGSSHDVYVTYNYGKLSKALDLEADEDGHTYNTFNVIAKVKVDPIKFTTWTKYVSAAWGKVCVAAGNAASGTAGNPGYIAAKDATFELANIIKSDNTAPSSNTQTLNTSDIQFTFGTKVTDESSTSTWAVNEYNTGNLAQLIAGDKLKIVDAYMTVNGAKNGYFETDASKVTASGVTIKQVQASPRDHEETLVIKAIDCYSKIITLNLTVRVKATLPTNYPAGVAITYLSVWNNVKDTSDNPSNIGIAKHIR